MNKIIGQGIHYHIQDLHQLFINSTLYLLRVYFLFCVRFKLLNYRVKDNLENNSCCYMCPIFIFLLQHFFISSLYCPYPTLFFLHSILFFSYRPLFSSFLPLFSSCLPLFFFDFPTFSSFLLLPVVFLYLFIVFVF